MSPLTRSRSSQPGDIPNDMNAHYYQQRATAGLILSEATQISPQGKGYAFTPGIHSRDQIDGWKKVTGAVHTAGGRIHMQLWHVGRISHPDLQPNGNQPVAPSAIKPEGAKTFISADSGMVDVPEPRALESAEEARTRISEGRCDLVTFGRPFIANPDLPERFRQNAPLNEWDDSTFYGGDEHGYTDYPTLEELETNA